jgi:hypothetical protein
MKAQKRERVDEMQALGRLMGDPAGRRWVYGLLSECHIWHTSMANNAIRMAFLEGERSQGLRLLAEVTEANPDMFLTMLKEMQGERSGASGASGANGTNGHGDATAGAYADDNDGDDGA